MPEYVLLTFKNTGIDLKVSLSFTAEELLNKLRLLYGVTGNKLRLEPAGILLLENKTLAEQKAEHGSVLEAI